MWEETSLARSSWERIRYTTLDTSPWMASDGEEWAEPGSLRSGDKRMNCSTPCSLRRVVGRRRVSDPLSIGSNTRHFRPRICIRSRDGLLKRKVIDKTINKERRLGLKIRYQEA